MKKFKTHVAKKLNCSEKVVAELLKGKREEKKHGRKR